MDVNPQNSGTITLTGSYKSETSTTYPAEYTCFNWGSDVTAQANPKSGYQFSRWNIINTDTKALIYSGSENPYTIVRMIEPTTVTAYFKTGTTPPPTPTLESDAGPDQAVAEGERVTLDGSGSTITNGTITGYLWKQIGGQAVTLSGATSAKPSFTAPDVQEGGDTLVFQLTVTSDKNDTDTDTVNINVQWVKTDTLVADAGLDQSVQAGDTVTLDGSGSTDLEGPIVDYEWKVERGSVLTSNIVLSNPEGETTTFTAPDAKGWVEFRLTVTNTNGGKDSDTIMVLVNKLVSKSEFAAHAGPDQVVASGSQVQLTGSATLPSGATAAGYQWNILSGPKVTLSGSDWMSPGVTNDINPTFTAPDLSEGQETITFQLRVNTTSGLTAVDEVLVTVSSNAYILGNAPPQADAGESQTVIPGAIVTLDASNSTDLEGKPLLYHWTAISGSEIVLSDDYVAKPTFVAPLESGSVTFELVVMDDAIKTDMDTVEISWQNAPPLADAGPDQEVFEGEFVALNGSESSDPDDGIATYQWEQLNGPQVSLSNAASADAIFAAPTVNGDTVTLTFMLTVTDHNGQTNADQVAIAVKNKNAAPVADAGPDQQVNETSSVVLRGLGSDPDGDGLSYQWVQISGPEVVLLPGSSLDSQNVSFTAPIVGGNYSPARVIFELTVSDSQGSSSADRVEILVNDVGLTPVADAGDDKTIYANTLITLDGTESKGMDNKEISYLWTQIEGQTVILSNVSSPNPTFNAPVANTDSLTLIFKLTVEDSDGLIASDEVTYTVYPATDAPLAEAGPDQSVDEKAMVILDASGSSDPDDGIKKYLWEQEEGIGVVLSDNSAVKPAFEAPKISEKTMVLKFKLTVEDYNGMKTADSVAITVNKKSSGGGGGCFISSVTD